MLRSILRYGTAGAFLALAFASTRCSVLASADLGKGIGSNCDTDTECHSGQCDKSGGKGICVSPCVADAECPAPALCVAGKCKFGCKDDGGCAAGNICEAKQCRPGCRADTGDRGCAAGSICEANVCKVGCRDDKGCPAKQICEAKACKPGCRTGTNPKLCGLGEYCEAPSAGVPGTCKASIQVAALVPGKTDGTEGSDAWSMAQRLGLDEAVKDRPFIFFKDKPYQLAQSVRKLDDAKKQIDDAVAAGAQAVVTTTPVTHEAAFSQAPKHPTVKFVAINQRDNRGTKNVAAYSTDTDAGWYVLGRLAGRLVAPTTNKCIGLILPFAGRQIVRDANAFIMGARKQVPTGRVVIRWLGAGRDPEAAKYKFTSASGFYTSPVDLTREQLLTAQLADLGCSVIAHHLDTQASVAMVETKSFNSAFKSFFGANLFSFATDLQNACRVDPLKPESEWRNSCAGSLFWSWGGKYGEIFDLMKAGKWEARNIYTPFKATADAVVRYEPHPSSSGVLGINTPEINAYLKDVQDTPTNVWDPDQHGGIKFNGQRDLDKNGAPDAKQEVFPGEAPLNAVNELERMCWFVAGAFEFPSCANASCTATLASTVPALVPYGPKMDTSSPTCATRADKCTSTLNPAGAADRAKYGDVIDFIRSPTGVAGDPQELMDCTKN